MNPVAALPRAPQDPRALIAVDLGAESCRVSLLRWRHGMPHIQLVHRLANGPQRREDGLRWPLETIATTIESGLRRCAALAPEGVRAIAVDGWAVDYVHVDDAGAALADPFCYRDERTLRSEAAVHARISPQRLRAITGVQQLRINTLYQLVADRDAGVPEGHRWLNLPEYMLTRWGGRPCAEYTNATHTQMVDLQTGQWSDEIFSAAGLRRSAAPEIVPPGTVLGELTVALAELPSFRSATLVAPACHDTSSAVAGIPARGEDWAYISLGTWSLVGALLPRPQNDHAAAAENFTNLGAAGGRICFHKNVNGTWLLKQCLDQWNASGPTWNVVDLISAAERVSQPLAAAELLDVDDPELLLPGEMPARINVQRHARGLRPLDTSAASAPQLASLIMHSLAARYAAVLSRMQVITGKHLARIFVVGGGTRNNMLLRLTEEATGLPVLCGSAESATLGNFAVQLARLEQEPSSTSPPSAESVNEWADVLANAATDS